METINISKPIEDAIQEARDDFQKTLEENYGHVKPFWPVVFSWLALVAWMLPIVGISISVITIIGGRKADRPHVVAIGIISLVFTLLNSLAGFVIGLNM